MKPDDEGPFLGPLRDEYEATDEQRARVWAKVRAAALASPAAGGATRPAPPSAPSPAAFRSWRWAGASCLGLLVVAGAAYVKSNDTSTTASRVVDTRAGNVALANAESPALPAVTVAAVPAVPPTQGESEPVVASASPTDAEGPRSVHSLPSAAAPSRAAEGAGSASSSMGPSAPTSVGIASNARVASAKSTVAPVDPLDEETRLLSAAARAAKTGDVERSLALIDEHERRYAHGQLSAERDVQRISVLCSAGRPDEARRRASIFLRGRDSSALTRRVEQSCAGR